MVGSIGSQFLQGVRNFFGKPTANVVPVNLDIPVFNSATQEWELQQVIIGTAVQSSSNVGSGLGLALARVGDDLPFRSLVPSLEVLLTGSATEIAFTIGAIAISKITGLQVELDSKLTSPIDISDVTGLQTELDSKLESPIAISDTTGLQTALDSKLESPIAISDTTGLQTALDSKVETASNEGSGVNSFIQKTLVNLEFRTLLANAEILITQNALDLAFSIGAIAQSKITGLVSALALKLESPIAISDTTGLQTALDTKIETLTNVGSGVGISKAKVLQNVDLKSILAGTGITINSLTDEIEIVATAQASSPSLLLHNTNTETVTNDPQFFAICGADIESSIETNTENSFPVAVKLQNMTIALTSNSGAISTLRIRKNGIDGNSVIVIPAGTTGIFRDVTNNDDFGLSDLGNYDYENDGDGSQTVNSLAIEVVNQ